MAIVIEKNITALINKYKYMPMFIAKKIILNELRKNNLC